uniref:MHC class I-like antigen recognition-like domain-containing protein n=1 Tax=Spermophilus dauricus TaxID=99837 RepID=A0A8C9P5F7_SPEDA
MGLGSLFLSFVVVSSPGAHSLHYNLTVRCQSGSVLSRFFAQARLDDQPFLCYDSERGSVVPCALWAETVLEPETWDTETQDLAESGKNLRVTLADINFLKEEKGAILSSDLGYESQEFLGCRWHSKQGSVGPCRGERFDNIPDLFCFFCFFFSSLGRHHLRDMLGLGLLSPEYLSDLASGWGTPDPGHTEIWEYPVLWEWDLPDLGVHQDSPRTGAEVQLSRGTQRESH